jgi:hypothetical protein
VRVPAASSSGRGMGLKTNRAARHEARRPRIRVVAVNRPRDRRPVYLFSCCRFALLIPELTAADRRRRVERGARPKHCVRELRLRNSEMSETPRFPAVSAFKARGAGFGQQAPEYGPALT